MRRWVVPLALAAIAIASLAAALVPPPTRSPSRDRPAPRAAVLSMRRVPHLLSDVIAGARLAASLDRFLADPDLGRNESCLVVSSAGGVLYERDPTRQLTPASTLKLLTAAVALERLPDHGFATRVAMTDAGDLVLIGGGDPLLATADYARSFPDQPRLFTDFATLADRVVAAGITRVGRVLGDESRYDTERYLPSWKPGYRTTGNMGALSALALNDGYVSWRPAPFAATADPAVQAAAEFTRLLRARGVAVSGEPGRVDAVRDANVRVELTSLKIDQIVGEMLVHSDNETAELLTKELGSPHTTVAGVAAIRSALGEMGYDVSGLAAADGSGLDTGDRVTCSLLHGVLTGSSRDELLDAGLAIAGQTGTLFDRFRNNPAAGRLKAKTGALEGVVGLAGVVEPDLTFAFLANGLPAPSDARGKRIQERLGAVLAAYPDAPDPASLAP